MADLGKSQVRQPSSAISPTGSTGYPLSSHGQAYVESAVSLDSHNVPSRNITPGSPDVTPAGFPTPTAPTGGQHYVESVVTLDAQNRVTKYPGLNSPITPVGFGSPEFTSGHGLHYAELNTKADANQRTSRSFGMAGGKTITSGATQADTGPLPIPTGGGPSLTTYFLMRARDQDCVSQPTYVNWVVTGTPDSTGAHYGGSKCGANPLVDIVVEQTWKQ